MLQGFFIGVLRVLQGCSTGVLWAFEGTVKGVSRMCQWNLVIDCHDSSKISATPGCVAFTFFHA